jgi:single-strand DNA-binding protein
MPDKKSTKDRKSVQGTASLEEGASCRENPSFNVAVVRGACSSPPELRVLPSDQRLAQLQITTRIGGRAMSVPVSVLEPAAWVEALDAGDEVVVLGSVRRRFFRTGGATASRVEIEAEVVCRARDQRRSRGLRRRIAELLEALES